MPKKDLVVRPAEAEVVTPEYPLLEAANMRDMLSVFRENVGDGGISTLELPRIQCPAGGALTWTIRTLEGEEDAKEIEGIVLSWRTARVYWEKPLGEGGGRRPPDCTSADGFFGVGRPGGKCIECPFAQFGSASKGRGQACKQVRQMLLVRPGEFLPHMISVPPTSLRNASQYFLMLLGRQMPYWTVTTRLRLERTQNEDGIAYARILFSVGRRLTPGEQTVLRPYQQEMRQLLSPIEVDSTAYTVVEEEPAKPTEVSDTKPLSGHIPDGASRVPF
jgi:hypothetical protein